MKTSFIYLPVSRVLAIVIWGWETKSASRPLMGFGELNDNMIKGLTCFIEDVIIRSLFVKEICRWLM